MREKREDVSVAGTGKEGEGGGRGGGGGGGEDMYRGTCRFRRVGEMGFRGKCIHSVCGFLRRVDVDTKGLGVNRAREERLQTELKSCVKVVADVPGYRPE